MANGDVYSLAAGSYRTPAAYPVQRPPEPSFLRELLAGAGKGYFAARDAARKEQQRLKLRGESMEDIAAKRAYEEDVATTKFGRQAGEKEKDRLLNWAIANLQAGARASGRGGAGETEHERRRKVFDLALDLKAQDTDAEMGIWDAVRQANYLIEPDPRKQDIGLEPTKDDIRYMTLRYMALGQPLPDEIDEAYKQTFPESYDRYREEVTTGFWPWSKSNLVARENARQAYAEVSREVLKMLSEGRTEQEIRRALQDNNLNPDEFMFGRGAGLF